MECKGAMRDLVVIVFITLVMLHSLHYYVMSKTSSVYPGKHNMISNTKPNIGMELSINTTPSMNSSSSPIVVAENTSMQPFASSQSVIPELIIPNKPVLLSLNKPVTSDVKGNLGGPEVVTSEQTEDWLKDRWQAAVDMSGRPIPGEHWLEIDLQQEYSHLHSILIDWETGYSNDWTIMGRSDSASSEYSIICISKEAKVVSHDKKHIIHRVLLVKDSIPSYSTIKSNTGLRQREISASRTIVESKSSQPYGLQGKAYRYVKLVVHNPATQWGSSVWRFQVWGS